MPRVLLNRPGNGTLPAVEDAASFDLNITLLFQFDNTVWRDDVCFIYLF